MIFPLLSASGARPVIGSASQSWHYFENGGVWEGDSLGTVDDKPIRKLLPLQVGGYSEKRNGCDGLSRSFALVPSDLMVIVSPGLGMVITKA